MAEDSASASRRSSARSRKAVARFDPISKARYELMKKHEEEAAADPTPGPGDTPFGDIDFVRRSCPCGIDFVAAAASTLALCLSVCFSLSVSLCLPCSLARSR